MSHYVPWSRIRGIHAVGDSWNLSTGLRIPGFFSLVMDNGQRIPVPEGKRSQDCVPPRVWRIYELECKLGEYARRPPPPEGVKRYQNDICGYSEPEQLGAWEWSTTFGRWGRLCLFPGCDGVWIYTWPEPNEAADAQSRIIKELRDELAKLEGEIHV